MDEMWGYVALYFFAVIIGYMIGKLDTEDGSD